MLQSMGWGRVTHILLVIKQQQLQKEGAKTSNRLPAFCHLRGGKWAFICGVRVGVGPGVGMEGCPGANSAAKSP